MNRDEYIVTMLLLTAINVPFALMGSATNIVAIVFLLSLLSTYLLTNQP